MHDQPGVIVLEVTDKNFAADLQAALTATVPYRLYAATNGFLVLVRGYTD